MAEAGVSTRKFCGKQLIYDATLNLWRKHRVCLILETGDFAAELIYFTHA
ncbi:hypothetical protein GCM10007905_25330 [Mixta theicola]|nr:hypothetical protein GCM10007905_25330 [Mixta theicola]